MPSCFHATCKLIVLLQIQVVESYSQCAVLNQHSGAFQISAPRSVGSKATVVWNRNDGDPDNSVFARRLLPAEVGDELSESPGSLPSGTIDVEFPVPG